MTTLSVLQSVYAVEFIIIVCLHLFSDWVNSASFDNCPPGFFYDSVLQKCEDCHSICIYAVLQRTEETCAQCRKDESPPKPSGAQLPDTSPVWVVPVVVVTILFILVLVLILAFHKIPQLQQLLQTFRIRLSQHDVRIRGNGESDESRQDDNLLTPIQEVNETVSYVRTDHPQHDPENQQDYVWQQNRAVAGQQMMMSIGFRVLTTATSDQVSPLENFELIGGTEMTDIEIKDHETGIKTL